MRPVDATLTGRRLDDPPRRPQTPFSPQPEAVPNRIQRDLAESTRQLRERTVRARTAWAGRASRRAVERRSRPERRTAVITRRSTTPPEDCYGLLAAIVAGSVSPEEASVVLWMDRGSRRRPIAGRTGPGVQAPGDPTCTFTRSRTATLISTSTSGVRTCVHSLERVSPASRAPTRPEGRRELTVPDRQLRLRARRDARRRSTKARLNRALDTADTWGEFLEAVAADDATTAHFKRMFGGGVDRPRRCERVVRAPIRDSDALPAAALEPVQATIILPRLLTAASKFGLPAMSWPNPRPSERM